MATVCQNQKRKWRRKLQKINNTPIEEVTSNLPCYIIEIILSRLPVKSLLKFKSVSKPWYSLISDSKFARVHLNQSIIKSDYITMISSVNFYGFKFWKLITGQTFEIEPFEFPVKKYREANVLCTCDGILLLKTDTVRDKMFVLWNPATRTYKTFSCSFEVDYISFSSFGLCYDATKDDYKVVYYTKVGNQQSCFVFFYKNNSWIEVKEVKEWFGKWLVHGPGLFLNGALHWVKCSSVSDNDRTYEILCFDPRDDKFKNFPVPPCFDTRFEFHLSALKGQLYLCRYKRNSAIVEIWTMKEYGECNSWTKLMTIDNVHASCYYVKPLCLTNEGSYVFDIGLYKSGIAIYHPEENKFDEIIVHDKDNSRPLKVHVYEPLCWNDSLLFPSRINQTKKEERGK